MGDLGLLDDALQVVGYASDTFKALLSAKAFIGTRCVPYRLTLRTKGNSARLRWVDLGLLDDALRVVGYASDTFKALLSANAFIGSRCVPYRLSS